MQMAIFVSLLLSRPRHAEARPDAADAESSTCFPARRVFAWLEWTYGLTVASRNDPSLGVCVCVCVR